MWLLWILRDFMRKWNTWKNFSYPSAVSCSTCLPAPDLPTGSNLMAVWSKCSLQSDQLSTMALIILGKYGLSLWIAARIQNGLHIYYIDSLSSKSKWYFKDIFTLEWNQSKSVNQWNRWIRIFFFILKRVKYWWFEDDLYAWTFMGVTICSHSKWLIDSWCPLATSHIVFENEQLCICV